ncbi:MAG: TlpA family protein disulfide reductase [Rhizobacter sp.]|nr:TlpA family protein disulfide reductase [Chlorobiales bacterium]
MKRFGFFLALLLLPVLAASQTMITGTLKTADGKVPPAADLHLTGIGGSYNEPMQTKSVTGGKFQVEVKDAGLYKLWFTAANHQAFGVPLVIESISGVDKKIDLAVQLRPYSYKSELGELKIIGEWNKFNLRSGEPMTKQADGSFVYEREASGNEIAYQVVGADGDGHSINGTMSDKFIYDGGGDYQSVVKASGGKVRIVFEPKKLLRMMAENLPSVKFDKAHAHLEEIASFEKQLDVQRNAAMKAYLGAQAKGEDMKKFRFDYEPLYTNLKVAMNDQKNPLPLRQFAAVSLASFPFAEVNVMNDSLFADAIRKFVPAESLMWAASMDGTNNICFTKDKTEQERRMRMFVDKNPDRSVRVNMLLTMTALASQRGESEKLVSLLEEMKSKYGDTQEAQFALKRFKPNASVAVGKAVPAFEVKLLGGETVSNKSMLGKYYMMDFWAVWCGPCVVEMPKLHEAYGKFKGKQGFEVLSLSFDQKQEDITKFRAERFKMPWLHTFVEGGFEGAISKNFEVIGIPKPVLIDPKGNIVATEDDLRGENLENTLAKFLGEPTKNN